MDVISYSFAKKLVPYVKEKVTTKSFLGLMSANIIIGDDVYHFYGSKDTIIVTKTSLITNTTTTLINQSFTAGFTKGFAVTENNNDIYLFGLGNGTNYPTSGTSYAVTVFKYRISTNTITLEANYPAGNSLAASAGCMYNGKIYAVGIYEGSAVTNKLLEYNISNKTFTQKASMSVARERCHGIKLDNYFYVFGGSNSSLLNTAQKYNLDTNVWSNIASVPKTVRAYQSLTFLFDDKINFFAGEGDGEVSSDRYYYDHSRNKYSSELPIADMNMSSIIVSDNKKIVYFQNYKMENGLSLVKNLLSILST